MILKEGVGFYFYPLHLDPTLHLKINEMILSFFKGGSAFRFIEPLSDQSIEKLNEILLEGWSLYQQNNWVT